MWIHHKPVFTTTSTAAALVPRATSDYVRSSSESDEPHCPPAYPQCNPEVGPGPALVPIVDADGSSTAHSSEASAGTGTDALTPTPQAQAALATGIQHFGRQNFIGLLVLGLLALAGLVLWLTFGACPRRMFRRLRARAATATSKGEVKGEKRRDSAEDAEGRRGADLGRGQDQAHAAQEGARARERSESDEGKDQPVMEEGAPSSPQSLEMEVEGLEKGSGEAKGRTLPRVRFA